MDSIAHLRVKIKSLAAEAKIIRDEERRAKASKQTTLVNSLSNHRRGIVRRESRHSQLAYGFMRNRKLAAIESRCSARPDWEAVRKMVERFAGAWSDKEKLDIKTRLELWREGNPAAKWR